MRDLDDTALPPESNQVDALLCGVFAAPDSEWPQRIEHCCATHPQHARELRRRFDVLRSVGFDALPPETPASEPFEVPRQLGEFRLRRRLGRGGMGMVFAAEQSSLGREVALKVVRPELLFADGTRERFRREVEAIARLEHPAIVPVLLHGEEHGVPYYVMPLVHGCSCDEVIGRLAGRDVAKLSGLDLQRAIAGGDTAPEDSGSAFAGSYWQACVRLLLQVALGLHHAHRRGIVHRDVKPSNMMLTPDGRALVLDFGLAHVRDDARITRTGMALGSPAYMSPEQVRGQASDDRTDVYSLAASLRHLLARAPPFPLDDAEVLRARILAGQVEPMPHRALPAELVVVLAVAMDIDRDRRHADALALADDLQAVLEQRPIRARALPAHLRLLRWCGRHRTTATVLAALVFISALLPGALWLQQRAASVALAKQTELAERSFTTTLAAIDNMLLQVGGTRLRNVPAAQRVAADLVQQALTFFDQCAAERPDHALVRTQRVRTLTTLSVIREQLGDPAASAALAERALQSIGEGDDLEPEWQLSGASAAIALAKARRAQGDIAGTAAALARAERHLAGEPPAAHRVWALGMRGSVAACRGDLAEHAGDGATAEACFSAALEASRELMAVSVDDQARRGTAVAAYNLARVLRRDGATDRALSLVREAAELLADLDPDLGGWPTPAAATALVQAELGRILAAAGDVDGSIAAYRSAIDAGARVVGDYPHLPEPRRDLGGARANLAQALGAGGELANGVESARAACADLERALQQNPADEQARTFLLNARKTLCYQLRELGDYPALALAARAFGSTVGGPEVPRGAARHLLRCAEHAVGHEVDGLRREALQLLLESERRGWGNARLDDELYAPLTPLPEFVQLRARVQAR